MQLNGYIDHTNLKQDATEADIKKLCEEAREHQFATVAINGCWVETAARELKGTGVGITACIGFPLGAGTSASKAFEAKEAVENGATEVDMVVNVGRLVAGDLDYVTKDIKAVVDAIPGTPLKVILECCLLNDEQVVAATECSIKAGAAFVKTSTGFSTGGATLHDVELMKETIAGGPTKIKAAGGIRTKEDAIAMIEAGADRIGASASIAICS